MARNPNKPAIGEGLLYFTVWAMAFLVPILNSKMMSEEHIYLVNLFTAWSKLLPYILIFIINNTILVPLLLFKRRYVAYFAITALMLVVLFFSLEYYQNSIQRHSYAAGGELYIIHGRASFTDLAWHWNVLLGMFLLGANCAIKYMFKSINDEQRMITLERQSLQAEMDYLKYQINPHFFMNTLNNIHALVDIDPEAAKHTVIELSKMMRYVLYDSESSLINVANDIRFIDNYINLMRIRYTDKVDIKMEVEEPLPASAQIPPLLLIVFVENAFKHGVSYNEASFVHINIRIAESRLHCRVSNSRHPQTKTASGGVGLENVQKRLRLLFNEDFSLKIDEKSESEYNVELSIPIK